MTKILKERRIKRLERSIEITKSKINYFYYLWKQSEGTEMENFYYRTMCNFIMKRLKLSERLVKILNH